MSSRIILTYEDYAALPDDGKRYELHEGELSVTFYWIIDPLARTIDAHRLEFGAYRLDARLEGAQPLPLPPFPDLPLDPPAIWP